MVDDTGFGGGQPWQCRSCATWSPAGTSFCESCGAARGGSGPTMTGPVGSPPGSTTFGDAPTVAVPRVSSAAPPGPVGPPTTRPPVPYEVPPGRPDRDRDDNRIWWLVGGLGGLALVLVVVLVVVLILDRGNGGTVAGGATSTVEQQSPSPTTGTSEPATTADLGTPPPTAPSVTAQPRVPRTYPATVPPTAPPPGDPELASLQSIANSQQGQVEQLVGAWVPQLDSKRVGAVADGRVWSSGAILDNYQDYNDAYGDAALLVDSSKFATFDPGYWVVVIDQPFGSAQEALDWCVGQGLGRDQCLAKQIAHAGDRNATTKLQPRG